MHSGDFPSCTCPTNGQPEVCLLSGIASFLGRPETHGDIMTEIQNYFQTVPGKPEATGRARGVLTRPQSMHTRPA